MKRGEVWWVNFDPSVGGEVKKQRPAVIVSNASNKYLTRVQLVPITSNIERLYPSEAYVVLNGKQRKAMSDQLTTVSKLHLVNRAGKLSSTNMKRIEQAVRTQLSM